MPLISLLPYYTVTSVGDPSFNNIVVLAHLDGANLATITADDTGKTITLGSGCVMSTDLGRFSSSSLKFDGTTNSFASFPAPALGVEDFTIEFSVRFSTIYTGVNGNMIYEGRPSNTNGPYPTIGYSNGTGWTYTVNGAIVISGGSAAINTWYHVAAVRSGGFTRLYVNGAQVGSTYTDSVNYLASTVNLGKNSFVVANMNGYIDELRVTKGIAQYTGASFTPPSAQFTGRTGSYTASLMHFDGANNDQTTTDETGRAVTLGSNARISNLQSKFGSTSIRFIDNATSYAKVAIPTIGTGDFTIEFFVRFDGIHGLEGANTFVDARQNVNGIYPLIYYHNGNWIYHVNNGARIAAPTTASTGVWYHVAVVRSAGLTRIYLNGTQIGGAYGDTNNFPSCVYTLGHNMFLSNGLIAHMDEFRVKVGEAVYLSNFTPPNAPFSV